MLPGCVAEGRFALLCGAIGAVLNSTTGCAAKRYGAAQQVEELRGDAVLLRFKDTRQVYIVQRTRALRHACDTAHEKALVERAGAHCYGAFDGAGQQWNALLR